MNSDFFKEYEFAQKVIRDAGEIASNYFKKGTTISFKANYSLLTQADTAVETFIKSELLKHFPAYGFMGEESSPEEKDISWIVDPIDGTLAFARGIHEFGIALALKKGNDVIFSVQYLPLTKEILTAYQGKGAYKNEQALHVSLTLDLKKTLFSLGLENFWDYQHYSLDVLTKNHNNRFRVGHSAVLESYYLASGKTDVLIKMNQKLWDVAPEYLLMKEAGAVITDDFGKPLKLKLTPNARHNYVATNKFLAESAKDILYRRS